MAAKQTVVTTGANSGIGFQVARHFAKTGARVVMACRSMERGQQARERIQQEFPTADTVLLQLDVSEQASVAAFAQQLQQEVGELDVLINNAGAVGIPLRRNSEGHELQLATNYLGAFGLTGHVLPLFKKTARARIVNVCSLAHRFGKLDIQNLNWEQYTYDEWKAYANSKIALLNHTFELSRRLQQRGSHIQAIAAHPGFAATEIVHKSESLRPKSALRRWYIKGMTHVIPSAEKAARSIILAASADHVNCGDYYGPGGPLELGGKPRPARINPIAKNTELGKQLWRLSESMTRKSYLSGS